MPFGRKRYLYIKFKGHNCFPIPTFISYFSRLSFKSMRAIFIIVYLIKEAAQYFKPPLTFIKHFAIFYMTVDSNFCFGNKFGNYIDGQKHVHTRNSSNSTEEIKISLYSFHMLLHMPTLPRVLTIGKRKPRSNISAWFVFCNNTTPTQTNFFFWPRFLGSHHCTGRYVVLWGSEIWNTMVKSQRFEYLFCSTT